MFEDSPREFTLGDVEVRAFLSAAAPHIVAVLPPGGDVGTGTLVRWKSLGLILTANHNLDGTKPSEVRFCFYPGGSLGDGPMTAQDHGDLYRGQISPVDNRIIADKSNDIVMIPLNLEDLPGAAKKKFLSSTYRAEDHFLLPYSRIEEGIRPYGISGAGAWCNADCPSDVWAARPLLVGVQTSWFQKSKLLQIVRIEPILSLLEGL